MFPPSFSFRLFFACLIGGADGASLINRSSFISLIYPIFALLMFFLPLLSCPTVLIFILTRHHLLRPSSSSHLHPDANANLSASASHDNDVEPTSVQLSPLPYIRTIHNDLATSSSPQSSSFTQQQFRLSTLDEEEGGEMGRKESGRRVSSPTSGLERKARGEQGEDARGLVRGRR